MSETGIQTTITQLLLLAFQNNILTHMKTEVVSIQINVTNFAPALAGYVSRGIVSSCHENYVSAHYDTLQRCSPHSNGKTKRSA